MDVKEKLVELANDVLRYLPWGEIQKDTAEQIDDRMMDHGVTVQEWISVKDRLPEVYLQVLVCDVRENYIGIWEYMGNEMWYSEKITWSTEDITHWMPLPQPPKGE